MTKKRRKYRPEYKFETVMESIRGEKSKAQICRERDITESMLYRWVEQFLEKGPNLFDDHRPANETNGKEEQIAELEQMVGRLTMELGALKKSMSWLNSQRQTNER